MYYGTLIMVILAVGTSFSGLYRCGALAILERLK